MKPITHHTYSNKINCNRCDLRTDKVIKIAYTNYPQHTTKGNPERKRDRVMTVCLPCRDEMVRTFFIMKLNGE